MKNTVQRSHAGKFAASTVVIGAMVLLPVMPALAAEHSFPETAVTAAETASADVVAAAGGLAGTPWRTTGAVDQAGAVVDLGDSRAAAFVGDAYFTADGTFAMYELNGDPKMNGLWEMRVVDGELVRWIRALDDAGATRFERVVQVVRLDGNEFTYRVSDACDPAVWVDIVHTPMSDPEPGVDAGSGEQNAGVEQNAGGEQSPGGEVGSDGGAPETGGATPETGDNQAGGDTASGSQNGGAGSGNANSGGAGDSLAVTGGGNAVSVIVASIVAVLSGAAVLIGRFFRRHAS